MPQLLFEIGVEELPALAIQPATAFINDYIAGRLKELRLAHGAVTVYGTPRRLVLLIDDLVVKQDDFREEILGPSVNIAFDQEGKLTKAALGFIKSKGVLESDIYRKTTDKGEVIAAHKIEAGRSTKDLLPALLIDMMRAIPFKKRMRWDGSGDTFARPIRWLLCLFDGETISLNFADVLSGKTSRGHRFMSPEPFVVISNDQYLREMKERFVMLASEERESAFIKSAEEKLAKLNAEFLVDHELMATVRNLFEYPFVVLGSFEEKYLSIPHEILICEMKAHQKCFAVYSKAGNILPYFICSSGTKPFDEEVFAKGNARVLRARFEDGAFYFFEDQKKTLREHADGLSSLIFERELGTVAEKSSRVAKVALELARLFGIFEESSSIIEKAAPILKADLVTGVVGQFPELQGVMGKIYAKINGEDPKVCDILEMHYWPRFAEDQLPSTMIASLFSIADRLDTLVGIIAIGKKPSGNKDPFALRRAAIGIVRMLVHFGFSIDVKDLIGVSLNSYGERFRQKFYDIQMEARDFLVQRARGLLIDDLGKESKEYAVNFADSALFASSNDLLDAFARAHTLYVMRNQNRDDFDSLVQAFKRASNIVKKAESGGEKFRMELQHVQYLTSPSEMNLLRAIEHTKNLVEKGVDKQAGFLHLRSMYSAIFSQVAMIKPKLDAFFDEVMVMVDDPNIRNARLALLGEIKQVADEIADFTHL